MAQSDWQILTRSYKQGSGTHSDNSGVRLAAGNTAPSVLEFLRDSIHPWVVRDDADEEACPGYTGKEHWVPYSIRTLNPWINSLELLLTELIRSVQLNSHFAMHCQLKCNEL